MNDLHHPDTVATLATICMAPLANSNLRTDVFEAARGALAAWLKGGEEKHIRATLVTLAALDGQKGTLLSLVAARAHRLSTSAETDPTVALRFEGVRQGASALSAAITTPTHVPGRASTQVTDWPDYEGFCTHYVDHATQKSRRAAAAAQILDSWSEGNRNRRSILMHLSKLYGALLREMRGQETPLEDTLARSVLPAPLAEALTSYGALPDLLAAYGATPETAPRMMAQAQRAAERSDAFAKWRAALSEPVALDKAQVLEALKAAVGLAVSSATPQVEKAAPDTSGPLDHGVAVPAN